ncbi:FG-GAP repeat domain-containing protein [Streptomyces sp. NBC_00859]|uniref:FG-GAP repeat domain-containing protein n=1 Tax=Streptomyces sp. NBC_00859 TaxID=2903682 RepID=UPI003867EBAF|nr:VCBS repeat-containing protein [Streptomyces sp. NBC_00859]
MKHTKAAAVAALTMTVLSATTGCTTAATAPSGKEAPRPCLSSGKLIGDLDGDGHPDRITEARADDKPLTLERGDASGHLAEPVSAAELVGARTAHQGAAVGDFNGDGTLDLALFASKEPEGDDPMGAELATVKLGPLTHGGTRKRTQRIHLDETTAIGVTDYNHDRRADLAVIEYAGDGMWEITARLGTAKGLSAATPEYAVTGIDAAGHTHRPLSADGLSHFYGPCEN